MLRRCQCPRQQRVKHREGEQQVVHEAVRVGKVQCSCAVREKPSKQVVAFAVGGELGGGWFEIKWDGREGSVGA